MKAFIYLNYNGKQYQCHEEYDDKVCEEGIEFRHMEGNDSCDCNRSRMIHSQCDNTFLVMGCGNKIRLEKIEFEK